MNNCQLQSRCEPRSTLASVQNIPELICVEFPGVGKNVNKMIESLGGIKNISEVYCEENRRMELRFRPSDLFCKPVCGERHNSTSVLIKVSWRRKKKKSKDMSSSSSEETDPIRTGFSVKPIGIVRTTFKFDNLCDFQYLPLVKSPDGTKLECISDVLLPQGMVSPDWLDQPAPLYLPPATFSRMDTPQDYRYKTESAAASKVKTPPNVISRTRQKRTHFTLFRSFKDKDVPQNPLPGAVSQVRCKFMDSGSYLRVKEEFTKRPIWSKNALRVRLKFSREKLKFFLPTVAYYFQTGPWRNLWVKFGYDPRFDPNAWLFQTFDFGIGQAGGMKTKVEAKRNYSNYVLPYKNVHTSKKKTCLISPMHLGEEAAEANEKKERPPTKATEGLTEDVYLLRPGMVPPYRQMFYQFCDIHIPEIQRLLETSILSDASQTCSEKNGWLPPGVETKCRDIMSNIIEKTLAERGDMDESLKDEQLSSSDAAEDSDLEASSSDDEA